MADLQATSVAEIRAIMEGAVNAAPASLELPTWLETADLLADFILRESVALAARDTLMLLYAGGLLLRHARQILDAPRGEA